MILIDYRDKRPLYEQVGEKLIGLIVNGALSPDEKLPSVRNLAMDLSVNPNTIQRAYSQLEQEGYIYTVSGRGNFVSNPDSWRKDHMSAALSSLEEALTGAYEAGIDKDQVLSALEKIYKGGRNK